MKNYVCLTRVTSKKQLTSSSVSPQNGNIPQDSSVKCRYNLGRAHK